MKSIWSILIAVAFLEISSTGYSFDTATIDDVETFGVSITAGGYHTCALYEDELLVLKVKCWGENTRGQLNVPPLTNPRMISAGGTRTCAVDDSGVKCWGNDDVYQEAIPALKHLKKLSAGWAHNCALDNSGVKCWGDNESGHLKIPNSIKPDILTAGLGHTCALENSQVQCWERYDDYDRLNIPALTNPKLISAGVWHTCALDDSGVKCWGRNTEGQLNAPLLVKPKMITAGGSHTCALDDSGVKCWGSNNFGQLKIPSLLDPKLISSGSNHMCAFDDSQVKCWGDNRAGQLLIPDELKHLNGPVFNVSNLTPGFTKIASRVYKDKKIVFTSLSKTLSSYASIESENAGVSIEGKNSLVNLYALYQSKVLLNETHSQYVEEKILPKLNACLNKLAQDLKINAVTSIDLSSGVTDINFTLVGSSLQASKEHLSTSLQQDLANLLLEVATAKASVGQNFENFGPASRDLLKALESHTDLITTLVQSERTTGFGKLLLSVESYLKSKN